VLLTEGQALVITALWPAGHQPSRPPLPYLCHRADVAGESPTLPRV